MPGTANTFSKYSTVPELWAPKPAYRRQLTRHTVFTFYIHLHSTVLHLLYASTKYCTWEVSSWASLQEAMYWASFLSWHLARHSVFTFSIHLQTVPGRWAPGPAYKRQCTELASWAWHLTRHTVFTFSIHPHSTVLHLLYASTKYCTWEVSSWASLQEAMYWASFLSWHLARHIVFTFSIHLQTVLGRWAPGPAYKRQCTELASWAWHLTRHTVFTFSIHLHSTVLHLLYASTKYCTWEVSSWASLQEAMYRASFLSWHLARHSVFTFSIHLQTVPGRRAPGPAYKRQCTELASWAWHLTRHTVFTFSIHLHSTVLHLLYASTKYCTWEVSSWASLQEAMYWASFLSWHLARHSVFTFSIHLQTVPGRWAPGPAYRRQCTEPAFWADTWPGTPSPPSLSIYKVQYLSGELLAQPTGGNVPSQLLELDTSPSTSSSPSLSIYKVQYLSGELLAQPTGGNVPSQLFELTPGQAHRLHLLYSSAKKYQVIFSSFLPVNS